MYTNINECNGKPNFKKPLLYMDTYAICLSTNKQKSLVTVRNRHDRTRCTRIIVWVPKILECVIELTYQVNFDSGVTTRVEDLTRLD